MPIRLAGIKKLGNTKCGQKWRAKDTDNTAESMNCYNCCRDKFIISNKVEYVNI